MLGNVLSKLKILLNMHNKPSGYFVFHYMLLIKYSFFSDH